VFDLGELFGFSSLPEIEQRPLPSRSSAMSRMSLRSVAPGGVSRSNAPYGAMFRQRGYSDLKLGGFGLILNLGPLATTTEEAIMAIQIVMDRSGHSRHRFDQNNAQELADAEQRFYELTGAGFTAAVRTGPGQVSRIRSFDPGAEETLFFPRLVGG
jgi:hypothetical protein